MFIGNFQCSFVGVLNGGNGIVVVVKIDVDVVYIIGDNYVQVFVFDFLLGVFFNFLCFGSEFNGEWFGGVVSDCRNDVWVFDQGQCYCRVVIILFFDFL